MRREEHPLSGATYEELGDGLIRVEKAGKYGIFDWEGHWQEGDIRYADPHLLQWVGGPDLPAGTTETDVRRSARMQGGPRGRRSSSTRAGPRFPVLRTKGSPAIPATPAGTRRSAGAHSASPSWSCSRATSSRNASPRR